MSETWQSPVDCDVTDYVEPQMIPAGREVLGQIMDNPRYDAEWNKITLLVRPLSVDDLSGLDPAAGFKAIEYNIWLPNPTKDNGEEVTNRKKGMVKRTKEAFGIPLTANLAPQLFVGKQIRFFTKAVKQKPESEAQYGPKIEVGRIVEVEGQRVGGKDAA